MDKGIDLENFSDVSEVNGLKEGDEFSSFEELSLKIRKFEEENYVCLYVRSSGTMKVTK